MAIVKWATGVSGTFTTAADWAGGVVPHHIDTAEINAAASSAYTVTLNAQEVIAGLILDESKATLEVTSKLTSPDIALQAGTLYLAGATLVGTVTETGGTLRISREITTLQNVTWQGDLDPVFVKDVRGQNLEIKDSLTLTGVNGSGPGTAAFAGRIELNDVPALNNASITASLIDVTNTPTLTLGAGLSLAPFPNDSVVISLQQQNEIVVNNGTLTNTQIVQGDSFAAKEIINNGTIILAYADNQYNDPGYIQANTFINNGLIEVSAGSTLTLNTQGLQQAGAGGSIVLDNADILLNGSLTTAQLLEVFAAQHVSSTGTCGFGVSDLNNNGATLTVGAGTMLGTVALFPFGSQISGGIVIDQTGQDAIAANLTALTLESMTQTLSFWFDELNDVTVTGATDLSLASVTITGGTLSNVGTLLGNYTLQGGTDIEGTGPGGSATLDGSITLTSAQSVAGDTFNISALSLGAGTNIGTATINAAQTNSELNCDSTGVTLGSGVVVNVNNATLTITCGAPSTPTVFEGNISGTGVVTVEAAYGGAPASYFDNSGIIAMSGTASGFVAADTGGEVTNSGTIQVAGGVLELTPSELTNTGVIELLDGTLKLDGDLTVSSLTEFTDPGSNLWVQGTLDLGGGTLSPGVGGTPLFALYGDVRDGKVVISSGITFSAYGDAIFMAPVVNIGTLDAFGLTAGGNITGTGTINLGGLLQLKASTGAGQLVNFISGSGGDLDFSTSAAATSFAGTIGTIGNGDTIGFAPLNGALLIGGSVAGDAIIAKFSNGATISLATKSQWTGSFTVDSAGLEYHTAAPSLADWSLPISSGSDQEAALSEARGALPQTAPAALDWFLPLHAR